MENFVQLLGKPAIRNKGQWLEPPHEKTSALLYYLAYKQDWVARDEILYLLWPNVTEDKARASLRSLISRLKKRPYYPASLEIETTSFRWQANTDIVEFKSLMQKKQFPKAFRCYKGDLLANYQCDSIPEYEHWLHVERAVVHKQWQDVATQFSKLLEGQQKYTEAADVLKIVHEKDKFDESILRNYLRLLDIAGEKKKLSQYFTKYQEELQQELALRPEKATLKLISSLEAQTSNLQTLTIGKSRTNFSKGKNLPTQLTPFIGREVDLCEIRAKLLQPSCRLLNLVSVGGMGKTRLAVEVARSLVDDFQDGVFFVSFAATNSPSQIIYTIASALSYTFLEQSDQKSQLCDFLKDKEILLVLDNLEHLLEGITHINDLLLGAAKLKILATSREPLNLRAEHVYLLQGLTVLEEGQTLKECDACKLFLDRARAQDNNFIVNDTQSEQIIAICNFLSGIPLAIELAASWLRSLTLDDIVTELKAGLMFFDSPLRDLPERHRSMQRVFDYSWQLLTEEEQNTLITLTVFSGGFSKEAASEVVGATLPMLQSLVNKSFIKLLSNDRYEQHPLMLQLCRAQVSGSNSDYDACRDSHAGYYCNFLHERDMLLATHIYDSKKLARIAKEIELEFENIRNAWKYATEHKREDLLEKGLLGLKWFLHNRMLIDEGKEMVLGAAFQLAKNSAVRGQLLRVSGSFAVIQGKCETSFAPLVEAIEIARSHQNKYNLALTLSDYAFARQASGRFDEQEIASCYTEALELYKQVNNFDGIAIMLTKLASFILKEQAELMYSQAIAICKKHDLKRTLAMAYEGFAFEYLLRCNADYQHALNYIDRAISIASALNDTYLQSDIILSAIEICIQERNLEQAEWWLAEYQELFRKSSTNKRFLRQLSFNSTRIKFFKCQYNEALASAQKALSNDLTDEIMIKCYVGFINYAKGDYLSAEKTILRCIEAFEPLAKRGTYRRPLHLAYCYSCLLSLSGSKGDSLQAGLYQSKLDELMAYTEIHKSLIDLY